MVRARRISAAFALNAAMPSDPAALWSTGADVDRLAEAWRSNGEV